MWEKQLNIFEKISKITTELWVVAKWLKVQVSSNNSYKAVSERDVLDAVKPLEDKYGVYSYPFSRELIESDTLTKKYDNGKETSSLYMRIKVVYRFVNIEKPQEYIDTIVYWDGIDTGDKAPWKAMTYADKYALMKAYKISTGDDPDKDASPENWYNKSEWWIKAKKAITEEVLNQLRTMDPKKLEWINVFQFVDKMWESYTITPENKKQLIDIFTSFKK